MNGDTEPAPAAPKKNGKSNGHVDEANKMYTWPTRAGACKRLGIEPSELPSLIRNGLTQHQAPDGSARFNPDELDDWQQFAATAKNGGPQTIVLNADVLKQSVELAKQAQEQVRELVSLVAQPIKDALAVLKDENRELREERKHFLTIHVDMIKAREELLNDAHIRTLTTEVAAKHENRKEKVFGLLIGRLPKLVEQVEQTIIGGDPKVRRQTKATIDLLKSIDAPLLNGLLELDLLDEKQKALVQQILNPDAPPAEPAKAETPSPAPAESEKTTVVDTTATEAKAP